MLLKQPMGQRRNQYRNPKNNLEKYENGSNVKHCYCSW